MIYTPHSYQQYCTGRILSDPALGLFLDMGLGKTVIALTAVAELKYNRWEVSRVLVIAPKKVAEATWSREAEKWDHLRHLRIVPVLDESSSFKNHQAKRFKALKLVRSRIRRLVELTGTPAPNGLMDLWAQVFLLNGGHRLGRTIGQYREMFFVPDKRNRTTIFSYAPRDGADETIRAAIGDICVSLRAEDYLELPDCIDEEIPVVLDAAAAKRYRTLEREMLLEVAMVSSRGETTATITAGTAAVLTNKLLQLCSSVANASVTYGQGVAAHVHDCKLEAFLETVEQLNGAHALVFYAFRHDLERMLAALKGFGLRVRVYQGPEDDTAWNAGEVDILLAHPASCAYGLNLQNGGHHIIWFGLTWSLEQYQQANARLHRQGQQHPVIVHHLVVQGGVDEDVMAALKGKRDTQEALMLALRARIERARG